MWQLLSPCKKIEAKLWDYLQCRLDTSEQQRVELHLESCKRCARTLEATRITIASISRLRESNRNSPANDWEQLKSKLIATAPPVQRVRTGAVQITAFACATLLIITVGVKLDLDGVRRLSRKGPINISPINPSLPPTLGQGRVVASKKHFVEDIENADDGDDEVRLASSQDSNSKYERPNQNIRKYNHLKSKSLRDTNDLDSALLASSSSKSVDGDTPGEDEPPHFINMTPSLQPDVSSQILQQVQPHGSNTLLASAEERVW